jgi:hypothetical protein
MTCSEVACFLHEEGNNNDLLLIDGRAHVALKVIGNTRASNVEDERSLNARDASACSHCFC